MNHLVSVIFLVSVFIIIFINNKLKNKENFKNIFNDTKPDITKNDIYMDFLIKVNDNLHIKECPVDSINSAFNNIELKREFELSKLDVENKVNFKSTVDNCLYKANYLSEVTNPMLYLTDTKQFPPPYIFKPFKNLELIKHTDLKRFSNMFSCCKNKFT